MAHSSAEAELYALTTGASHALGFMTLQEDFGPKLGAVLLADAFAAICIMRRSGFGKLRNLNVRYLLL